MCAEHTPKPHRFYSIDLIRGVAVGLMIIYHFFYDYGYFGYWEVDLNAELEWRVFRYTIMSLFLFTVGMSVHLQHRQRISVKAICQRIGLLGGACVLVSAVSLVQFPHSWIYFGILHFILVASLLALLVRKQPIFCLVLAILIILGYSEGYLHVHALFYLMQPLLHLPQQSEDLVPLFPWLGVVFLGVYSGYYRFYDFSHNLSHNRVQRQLADSNNKGLRVLLFMGRHALWMYLIHQPFLFAGFWFVSLVS